VPQDSTPPRVGETCAEQMLLEGSCPLCRVTLEVHGVASCCPCCGCGWRATIKSIELLSCSLHPICACQHWVTICEAVDRVLNTTWHRQDRGRLQNQA